MDDILTKTNFVMPSCSTAIRPPTRMASLQHRNSMAYLFKTLPAHHRSFSDIWQRSAQEADSKPQLVWRKLKSSTLLMPTTHRNLDWYPDNKLWDIYGRVTDIGPYHRYYVKTQSGCVLIRYCRFLRRLVPTSIPTTNMDISQQDQSQSARRYPDRQRNPRKRLIEDPSLDPKNSACGTTPPQTLECEV